MEQYWFGTALVCMALVVGLVAGYQAGTRKGEAQAQAAFTPPPAMVLDDELAKELLDLRHLRDQIEHPEQPIAQHEHLYPREPDTRKLGWLRYQCIVPGCTAIQWKRKKVLPT